MIEHVGLSFVHLIMLCISLNFCVRTYFNIFFLHIHGRGAVTLLQDDCCIHQTQGMIAFLEEC